MAFEFGDKQRVKDATDIVDLVGSYLQLRRDGRNYKALCPWHDDSRPSLQVNPERQSWKCWVCDVGGDAFSFFMKMEGVGFSEALSMLADRAGIRMEQPRREPSQGAGSADDKRMLYQAMAWADQQYHRCLKNDPQAEVARQYLAERGITAESIERFHLGFSPESWDWILQQARDTSFNSKMLERIGLAAPRRNGPGHYDRFRARVLFPIYDSQARAVGIGGRIMPQLAQGEAAKYVNSPETPLFSKHKLLYGLNVARDSIRKSGTALIMEGYTDCIVAHQYGFENAVAVLGTALGTSHIRLLNTLGENVRMVLVLDGDDAGRKRAKEVLELFVAENANLRVLTLPDELDPCEFLLERGANAFHELIDSAADALTHAVRTATAGIDLARDVHGASQALEQLVAVISKAPRAAAREDHLREEKFLSRLAADFRVSEEVIREKLRQLRQKSLTRPAPRAPEVEGASIAAKPEMIAPYERELMEILLRWPHSIAAITAAISPEDFASAACRQIFERACELAAEGVAQNFERLLLEFDDPVVKNLLVEFDQRGQSKYAGEIENTLRDVLCGFERRKQEPRRHAQTAALKERRLEEEAELAILLELQQQERNRQGISRLTEG